jgi:uncharacterized protein
LLGQYIEFEEIIKMTKENIRQLINAFFCGLSDGHVPDELLTPEMTFWSISAGETDKARFHGAIKILAQIANKSIRYDIVSLTAEEDRVVAEIKSNGNLINGEAMQNNHIFLFRLRDGKIASVAEYMNQMVVREKIVPLMQAAMAKPPK